MMKVKVLLKGLLLLVCMLMLSVSPVLAQDPCEGIDIDGDGSTVLRPDACDTADRYGECTETGEACANVGECPTKWCSATTGGCTVDGDCPSGQCSNGDACTDDTDCPTWSPTCILTNTCEDMARCSESGAKCTDAGDCATGVCSETGDFCSDAADCPTGECADDGEA